MTAPMSLALPSLCVAGRTRVRRLRAATVSVHSRTGIGMPYRVYVCVPGRGRTLQLYTHIAPDA